MTLYANVNQDRGLVSVVGENIPNGDAILTRQANNEKPYLLRAGTFEVTTQGFIKDDTEAPFSAPIKYQLTLTPDDRIVQKNLVNTPTALHGAQSFAAGTGRTLTIVADATAHSASVFRVPGNPSGSVATTPPTLVGHVNAIMINGSTVITPPSSGGSAIATNDWVYILHNQLATAAAVTISGFTKVFDQVYNEIEVTLWRRKKLVGDTGYTVVTAASGADAMITCFWVRGGRDAVPIIGTPVTSVLSGSELTVPSVDFTDPSLVVTLSSGKTNAQATPPGATSITNSTFSWSVDSGTLARTSTVATKTFTDSGTSGAVVVRYNELLTSAVAVQVAFLAPVVSDTTRTIAQAPVAAMAAGTGNLVTGRFRFTTPDVWLWADVKAFGSWAALKAAKANWAAVRSSTPNADTSYVRLFVTITSSDGSTVYAQPVQVAVPGANMANKWVDFSFLFDTAVDIPAGSLIKFLHGTSLREYAVVWNFDELGLTKGSDRATRNTLYWFDGDSTVPERPSDNLVKDMTWEDESHNSTMTWAGTVGNSVSTFTGPSVISTSTTVLLPAPEGCEPVYLNDPVSPTLGQWYSLIGIGDLSYAARLQLFDVLSRASVTAVSDVRSWAAGELTLMTRTMHERTMAEMSFSTGRIMFLRNPNPAYPETSWYIAIGDVTESRLGADHRRPERLWTVPFSRVERPTGLIDSQSGRTWQIVRDAGTWLETRMENDNWMEVLTERVSGL